MFTSENGAAYAPMEYAATPQPWLPPKGDIERDLGRLRNVLQTRVNGLRDLAGEAVAGPLFAALTEFDGCYANALASWTQAVDERDQLRRDTDALHTTIREMGTALAAADAEREVLRRRVADVTGSSTARMSKSQAQDVLAEADAARVTVYDKDALLTSGGVNLGARRVAER